MVGCWVIRFRYIAAYPATTQIVIFGYCVVVDSYCTWQYRQTMLPTSGTLRRRLRLIALSAGLFTIAVAGNVLTPMLPTLAINISAVGLAMTAISAILYTLPLFPRAGCVTLGTLRICAIFSTGPPRLQATMSARQRSTGT